MRFIYAIELPVCAPLLSRANADVLARTRTAKRLSLSPPSRGWCARWRVSYSSSIITLRLRAAVGRFAFRGQPFLKYSPRCIGYRAGRVRKTFQQTGKKKKRRAIRYKTVRRYTSICGSTHRRRENCYRGRKKPYLFVRKFSRHLACAFVKHRRFRITSHVTVAFFLLAVAARPRRESRIVPERLRRAARLTDRRAEEDPVERKAADSRYRRLLQSLDRGPVRSRGTENTRNPKTSVRYHSLRHRCVRVKSGERFAQRPTTRSLSRTCRRSASPRKPPFFFFFFIVLFVPFAHRQTRDTRDRS